ncbi:MULTISPECIES: BON domain-containing protein [Chryseobacterium]|jgi:hyperosmotically inducible protein|uniref:BON domain-containing protein n=1 Tax=Chryseobacterium indoltheticum TaxID=254 RepID=A0A381F6B5_9FLAO|nr:MULTISPECIES: BON domain-containing protein [Chryseobacterium]AZA62842.1 BON domain-containing protein [Chryseobacterium indoltheticum]AZA75158.1 BON domain-containing protein [Chryseobacterium indoltheticum]MDQ8141041.1 BON domain-containing protein [Chryseobacterium sp. CFS15]QQQ28119.1 BON domain-containing protein [Chryseobacterium indoltheticum]SIR13101.1 hyperosmotically inducible protein [Chryseobacterium indoltheticum]
MKKTITMSALALAISFGAISCKKKVSDADLQTQATTIVAASPTATIEVKEGVAHLGGTFATQAEKDAAIKSLKEIKGVKDVHDMATVEVAPPPPPVETASAVDPMIQQKVQDAVKDFPSVKVEVVNGELTLTGNVSAIQARKIKESVDALKVGKYNNNLVVK